MTNMCGRCGDTFYKNSSADPMLCRLCERSMTEEELYAFMDMMR